MRGLFSLFTTVCLVLWVMPLGAFIKPSQEKTACDGQRAFHMCCSMEFSKVHQDSGPQKISFTNTSGVDHQPKSKGSGGNHFVSDSAVAKAQDLDFGFQELNYIFPKQTFFLTPEPIPKV